MGASPVAVATVRMVTEAGHEAVLIDKNQEKLDRLAEILDCGFVCDDGSRPSVLREVGAEATDLLFCLSDDDQDNIIASLVGRELGFSRVVTKVEEEDFEPICHELGLDDPIVPSRRIGESLLDLAEGRETAGLNTVLRGGLRFYAFEAGEDLVGPVSELDLGCAVRVVALTRDDGSLIVGEDSTIEKGDQIVIIVHADDLDGLQERLRPDES